MIKHAHHLCWIIVAIAGIGAASAQLLDTYGDVRGLIWGVTMEDVKVFEEATYLGEFENALSYEGEDGGFPSYMTYYFYEGQLGRAQIEYKQMNSNPQKYLFDYIELQNEITHIYGPPIADTFEWSDEGHIDDPERWGVAAMRGMVEFETRWSSPTTIVQLKLGGERMRASLTANYISKTVLNADNQMALTP